MSKTCSTICFLFLAVIMHAQSIPDEVVLSYSAKEKNLAEALIELSDKSGVNISFSEGDLPPDKIININVESQTLGAILKSILNGLSLDYNIVGNQLVIFYDEYAPIKGPLTISGYIEDAKFGERIAYANIYLDNKSKGTQSNEYGFYSLTLKPGLHLIHYSYLGFEKKAIHVALKRDTTIHIEIQPNVLLNEILIIDQFGDHVEELEDAEFADLNKMSSITSLGGESDIIRYSQMQAGVTTGSDGFGGMHVRGGEVDQNLILLDGVPVYNAGHALGIFSIFNPSTIKSAKLIKNGFPARYGGRLSSVLDVRTREGSTKSYQGDLSLGTAAVKATIEGPLTKGNSSFIVSGRRTFLDPWIKQASQFQFNLSDEEGSTNYYFYDLNGKLNFKVGDNHRFYLSLYNGRDRFENYSVSAHNENQMNILERNENSWDWGNSIASFRWNAILNQKLFANISTHYSLYEFELFDYDRNESEDQSGERTFLGYFGNLFRSEIKDYGARLDLTYIASPVYTLRFGTDLTRHQFQPGVITVNEIDKIVSDDALLQIDDLKDTLISPAITGYEYSLYFENEFKLGGNSGVNIGLHSSLINTGENTHYLFEPRFSLAAFLGGESYFKSSFSMMNQYLHLLTNAGLGLPNDVWLPSTDQIGPQSSIQGSAGFSIGPGKSWTIETTAFYKKFNDIISYPEGGIFSIVETEDWESEIPVGEGEAYGVELEFRKDLGKFSGWCNYTLSRSQRKFEEINGGLEYFSRFDRRHNFNISWIYRINQNTEFTFNWLFGTGSPITVPTEIIKNPDTPEPILIFGDRNNSQLLDYHRLDLSFNFYNKYSWGQQKLSIGLYNAYNRKNPIYVDIRRDEADLSQFEFVQISIFPVLPSISYKLAF